jgi:hypothetical protein
MRSHLVLSFAALVAAAPAGAATLYVGQEGLDEPGCGTRTARCRSISQAITLAGNGDTVLVGPGHYGDVNVDGDFADSGDEAAELGSGCDCMIAVPKELAIVSEAGAGATVIDGRGITPRIVAIAASGVVFGRRNQGFTVRNQGPNQLPAAVETGLDTAGVSIAGNVIEDGTGMGLRFQGSGHSASDNRFHGNVSNVLVEATNVRLARNVSSGADFGLELRGAGAVVTDDVVVANGIGVIVEAASTLERVAVVGNTSIGVLVQVAGGATLRGGRIVGNGENGDPVDNCGVFIVALPFEATGVWWGAPDGPGANPADVICTELTLPETPEGAKKAAKLRVKPVR